MQSVRWKTKKYSDNILFLILLKKNNKHTKLVTKNSKMRACMDLEESKLDDIICDGFIL